MFGYEYVNLTPEQVEARRTSLNDAGSYAYLAPYVILSTVFVSRHTLSWIKATASNKSSQPPSAVELLRRRLNWLLTNTYIPEFGPLQVQVTGILYGALLLYIIVRGTGNDYMHVTKAFAHVAISQLPLHYLLAVKHPWSPITFATGLTHERLNNYHRMFGRIVHALLATHAILYLKFFADKGLLAKRIQDWDVRYGLMAFWSMNFLGLLAIPPIRKVLYHKVFYRSHVILSVVLLLVVWLHVPFMRIYVQQAFGIWCQNASFRWSSSEYTDFSCRKVGNGLVEVKARLKSANWENWVPGMHGYLNQKGLGPKNPFTVVSVDQIHDGNVEVTFVVRDLGGPTTSLLGKEADGKKKLDLQLEGPYGESKMYLPGLLRGGDKAGKVLIVAGGVGATYSLPIYIALMKAWSGRGDKVRLSWIVRDINEAKWGLDMLQDVGSPVNVQLFVTNPDKTAQSVTKANTEIKGLQVLSSSKRPDMSTVVGEFVESDDSKGISTNRKDKLTVMVCGPPGLSQSLRKAVGNHLDEYAREVAWYEEQFGFGGS